MLDTEKEQVRSAKGKLGHPTMRPVPLISSVQRIVLYETKARFFLVGSNNRETKFRVLKIDRTEPKELVIIDDKVEYTQREVRELLSMLDVGNRATRPAQKGGAGLTRTVSAFGIVGFVRFLEGYYIVLITKRRRVAILGGHTIYKIEDTSMIYIPNDSVRYAHPDESRYVKIFQNVDLSSNFYFSYSYDLTHTLQFNLTAACNFLPFGRTRKQDKQMDSGDDDDEYDDDEEEEGEEEGTKDHVFETSEESGDEKIEESVPNVELEKGHICGVQNCPEYKYVWNSHMLEKFEDRVHPDWRMSIIHGFCAQSNVCVYGRPIFITLIARRSILFAGTRFLKRGANCEGQVANEVETEQIVHDASVLSLASGRYTAYVQMRGSVPLYWSQDITTMMPKPPIGLDLADPYAYIAGLHFNDMMKRYGSPVIILNLVKKREKRKHESVLTEELVSAINYLNQFLPPQHAIQYIAWDMARFTKSKNVNVMERLGEIADRVVMRTGFFKSGPHLYCTKLRPEEKCSEMQGVAEESGRRQTGVLRTNCVDCLDRTNTAQFVTGKVALAFQLYSLGVLEDPKLEFDTDAIRVFEELYEDMGDTLALQYGGSQLVHSIQSYRKLSPWTSHSRDIMQTLSRYYSNAFSDAEKQSAINLFLGVFLPHEGRANLWDLPTDYYLHHTHSRGDFPRIRRSYTQWWEIPVLRALPLPQDEVCRDHRDGQVVHWGSRDDERLDEFSEYYRPFQLTVFEDLFVSNMPHSIKDFMPNPSDPKSDPCPFAVRKTTGKFGFGSGRKAIGATPPPTAAPEDNSSSESDVSSEDDLTSSATPISPLSSSSTHVSFKDLFQTMKETYGVSINNMEAMDRKDLAVYRRYVMIGLNASKQFTDPKGVPRARKALTEFYPTSAFKIDSSREVIPPTVDKRSKKVYEDYLELGKTGHTKPITREDFEVYRGYVSKKYK
ncbi:PREDICTED: polyphosphoinositide phosphatase-like [Branchiostoma belcheri]|uniref:Polyphosphoinositide phosphatase-like n=1 Tax=Branchiostoma belcheri TaxID=7741 RepID=A0A6P4ZD41_BRABE|nr:PREDICTED: polyphosphoinositide phosphatase-like [Branchiostoma belcheri]